MTPSPGAIDEGDRLDQEEIEAVFDTGFGYRISGINVRRDDEDERYILLFANEDGPYDDNVREGEFRYIGEGLSGDQSASTTGNASLIDAVEEPVPIHFFYKGTDEAKWEYQGRVEVRGYEYVERDGRKVFEFTMRHAEGPTAADVAREREEVERLLKTEPQLTDDAEYSERRRRARDRAFAEAVKDAYDYTCLVCGSRRESPDGGFEVEAAHIYPKREGGADDPRNGLALCRLHHWAFDAGWISVTESYEIEVAERPDREGYHEFKQLAGDRLSFPGRAKLRPHEKYLRARSRP